MKDDSASGESTAMMARGAISHDDISDCQSPAATAAALVTPTKKKHSSPPSSPPSAKVIHYTDARTKALGVKAELEELRRKQLAKNKRNEIGEEKWCATYKSLKESNRPHHSSSFAVDNGQSVPLSSSEIENFFLRKTQMDKAWRHKQRESIEYLHTYKNSAAMANARKSSQSTVKNSSQTIYSEMDPFYRQQRALNQEWKRQQQASMAFLHNYRSAGTGLNGVGNNTNENEAIVIPAHGDGHQAGIIEYDIDAAIRFHELQKSLDERMTLAVNTPLPPDIDEPILTLTESVNEDVNDCELVIQVTGTYDPEKEGAERDENTDDEQSRPMDPVSKEMADENNDDSGECLEEELCKENPTVFHMNLKDEPANETIDDDIDDIDEVLDDLLGDTYEQDGKRLIFESKVDADKDLEPPELRRIANEPEGGDENKNESSEMNGFDKLVEYMSANISSETAPDNLEELLELQNDDTVVRPPRSDVAEIDDTRDEAKVETAARPSGPITSSPTIEYEPTEIPKGTLPDRQMSQIATPPPSSRSRAKKKVESKIVRPKRRVANQNGGDTSLYDTNHVYT